MVDLGPDLRPSELVAVGYDEQREEIARASQVINLPRPMADFEIVLHSDWKQIPTAVELRWRHLANVPPKRATMTIDGTALKVDAQFHGRLPRLDSLIPHVFSAEMRFEDAFLPDGSW